MLLRFSFVAIVLAVAQHLTDALFAADMEGNNQTGQQQHGGQLHRQYVRAKQRNTNFFRAYRGAFNALIVKTEDGINDNHQQHRGEDGRADPDPRLQPLTFLLNFAAAKVKHHHHEDEQHHDGTGVNDDLQRPGEVRAQREEHASNR